MEFRQLRYFIAVAEELHFGAHPPQRQQVTVPGRLASRWPRPGLRPLRTGPL